MTNILVFLVQLTGSIILAVIPALFLVGAIEQGRDWVESRDHDWAPGLIVLFLFVCFVCTASLWGLAVRAIFSE